MPACVNALIFSSYQFLKYFFTTCCVLCYYEKICLINYKLRRSLGQNIKIPFRIKVHNLLAQNYSLQNFFIFVAHSQNQETRINCYQYDDRQKTIEGCSPLWPRNSSLSRLNSSSSKVFCFVSASNSFRH